MSEEKDNQPQQETRDWKHEAHRQAVMRIVESAHRKNPFYDKKWTAEVLLERSDMREGDDGQIDIVAKDSETPLSQAYTDVLEINHFRENVTTPKPVSLDDEPQDLSVPQMRELLRKRKKI